MKVRFNGISDPLSLLNGKEYEVEAIECGWYRIVDETGEDYLYPPESFIVVSEYPMVPALGPSRENRNGVVGL